MDLVEDPQWRRVATLRPRLRLDVRVQRREGRGGSRYMLCDDLRRRFHVVDPDSWQFIGRLDGQLSVDDAWQAAHRALGEDAPTQSEAIEMLQRLSAAGLFTMDAQASADVVLERRQRRRERVRAAVANPLSFQVPLFDPKALLDRLMPVARALVSPIALLAWLLLVLSAVAVLSRDGAAISHQLGALSHTSKFLLQMWAVYPLAKVLHEAGHALALSAWGGEVRQVGVNVMMLTPLPYVDASAATAIASRRRRILVSAMGILVEVALAAIALLAWAASSSVSVQAWALAVAAGCGLSTLVFNANPLSRCDGYYILSDLLDLPNLQARGRAMLAWLFKRASAGSAAPARPEHKRLEAVLVTLYGLSAWLWQAVVATVVSMWLFTDWPAVGVAVFVCSAVGLLWHPVNFALRFLALDRSLVGRRARPMAVAAGIVAGGIVLVGVVPMPTTTVVSGIVWTAPDAIVRPDIDGDVVSVLAAEGDQVRKGQALLLLDNLEVRNRLATALARLQILDVRLSEVLLSDPVEAAKTAQELDATRTAVNRLNEQVAMLTVRAPSDGTLVWPRRGLEPNQPCRQGQDLAVILSDRREVRIKAALDESEAAQLRAGISHVGVILDPTRPELLPARLDRETPAATRELPVAALSASAGGPVAMDPADPNQRRTLAPVVVVDVLVDAAPATAVRGTDSFGGRAWLRFDHSAETLATHWTRELRRAFLPHFGAGR